MVNRRKIVLQLPNLFVFLFISYVCIQFPVWLSVSSKTSCASKWSALQIAPKLRTKNCSGLITIRSFDDAPEIQMFQYAALYGIAAKNNMLPSILKDRNFKLQNIFPDLSIPTGCSMYDKFEHFEDETIMGKCNHQVKFSKEECQSNIQLSGDFRSWKYFDNVKHLLQAEFSHIHGTSESLYSNIIQEHLSNWNLKPSDIFHIIIYDPSRRKTGNKQQMEFIEKALSVAQKNIPLKKKLVVSAIGQKSNDLAHLLKKFERVNFISEDNRELEFMVMRSSDVIILNYLDGWSWWAAYLNENANVYLKQSVRTNLEGNSNIFGFCHQYEDVVLPAWINL